MQTPTNNSATTQTKLNRALPTTPTSAFSPTVHTANQDAHTVQNTNQFQNQNNQNVQSDKNPTTIPSVDSATLVNEEYQPVNKIEEALETENLKRIKE